MRISDWSSDVCSSDLLARAAQRREDAEAAGVGEEIEHARIPRHRGDGGPMVALVEEPAGLLPLPRLGQKAEIGRASCRERVCQYVSISVVAVSLKNKNQDYRANHTTMNTTNTT